MPSLVALLFVLAAVYIAWRFLVWMLILVTQRTLGLEISIQGVGIFAFSNVCITYRKSSSFTLEVERMWFSSCYLNKNTRKVIGLCTSGIRLQIDIPASTAHSNSNTSTADIKERKIKTILKYGRIITNWVSVHADNICCTVRTSQIKDCILHITVGEIVPEVSIQQDKLSIFWAIQGCTTKLLHATTQNEPIVPCIGQLQFSHLLQVTASVQNHTQFYIQEVTCELTSPQIHIQRALFHVLPLFRIKSQEGGLDSDIDAGMQQVPSSNQQNTPLISNIPQKVDIRISELELKISDEEMHREICLGVQLVQTSLTCSISDECIHGQCELHVKDLWTKSMTVNLCNLHMLQINAQADDKNVDVDIQVLGGFLGYHHDELLHWIRLVSPHYRDLHLQKQRPRRRTSSSIHRMNRKNKLLQTAVGKRPVKLSCNIKHPSAAVAMTTCCGVKLGLAEVKLVWIHTQQESSDLLGSWSDHKIDFELNSMYCKLAEGSVSSAQLSPRRHHHNTLMYLGLLVVKSNLTGHPASYDIIVDNIQLELSTHGLSVINSLVSHIIHAGTTETSIYPDPVTDNDENGIDMECSIPQQYGNYDTVQANIQFTNITVFANYEDKAGAVLRIDELMMSYKESQVTVMTKLIKMAFNNPIHKVLSISRGVEMQDCIGQIKQLHIAFDSKNKSFELSVTEELSFDWSMALHLCVLEVVTEIQQLKHIMSSASTRSVREEVSADMSRPWSLTVQLPCVTHIQLFLQKQHSVSLRCPEFVFRRHETRSNLYLDQLNISFDQQEIFNISGINVSTNQGTELRVERQSFEQLNLPTNRTWVISFEKFNVTFPYNYKFAACFEEVKNVNKWRKLVYHVVKKPFTLESTLPPDLVIKLKSVRIQVCDDPFEVKLGDNYKLMCDEYEEHKKRVQTLDLRIQDLRKKHGLLPASKVEELYSSLESSRGQHYIGRSCGMYGSVPARTTLWYWVMENLEITALADTSIHGTDNVLKNMQEIDSESPYPASGLDFVTLWCRMVNVSNDSFVIGFRDYPLPIINIEALHVWGHLIGAEQRGEPHARRTCTIEQGTPWGRVTVERNMPALKFYHDFSCDVNVFNIAYGGCWEAAMAQFNLCMNLINQPSADLSRPLPIWDKLRVLLHGRLTMCVDKMSWIYPASLDPYNKTEMMDWTWSKLILDWTNTKWVLRGDLDIYARTASKYDDCRLLHLPNLRFCIRLHWLTLGDPNDHHSVMPCAPDKRTVAQDQDSYVSFRSQGVNMSISFVTKPTTSDLPACLFYASTLRWMDKVKMCMARVSRPIRKGKFFNYTALKKPQFTRYIRDLSFSVALHGFEIDYWASFARQIGLKAKGGTVCTDIGLQLSIQHREDGLVHRPQAEWSIQQFKGHVIDFTIWLCTAKRDKGIDKQNLSLQGPISKSYLISMDRVSYDRTDPNKTEEIEHSDDMETDLAAVHHLQVHNLRGAWTPSNRDVALAMYDAYVKSQRTKKNLSSEALHGFKVDTSQSPQKLSKSLNTSGAKTLFLLSSPPPMSKLNDPGFSMLQQLLLESDTKFLADSEEMPEPELLVKQLHGIAVCDTDDVTTKNWHVELYNAQVVLRGVETSGYVIVSAAKASLLACDHKPIWQGQQLRSKSTLVGSVESMQYYATVASEEDLVWLSEQNIADHKDSAPPSGLEGMIGLADMVGSGHSVGGVVTDGMSMSGQTSHSSVQLQRIVSRCHCEFFYADYREVEDKTLPEVPIPPSDTEMNMLKREEGVDCFTLLHHDLNVCTNSLQYDMILDIVNNLLLHVEPKKKELTEKLENMRFSLQLGSVEDQKTPILQRQNTLRDLFLETRQLERQLFNLHRTYDDQLNSDSVLSPSEDLQRQLEYCKDQVNALSEELAIMVSCFKENQLQVKTRHQMATAHREVPVRPVRMYEVCFKHAEWRMTEDDGQIGIADLVLKNFLYKKTSFEDVSGAHQLDLGWVRVTNLLPGTPYREVLVPCDPQGKVLSDRLSCLRILCRFKAPVGGISVKEHFEVNVAPLTIQLTARFYKTAMSYFFRDKQEIEDDDTDEIPAGLMENHPSQQAASTRGRRRDDRDSLPGVRKSRNSVRIVADLDKMKERAAKNNMFLYIKIPEVPMRISYKGDKEKNITNIHDFQFLLPTLEYHDQTWTWHDLALALKNDSKKRLIGQAVQQKLHLKIKLFDCGEEEVFEDAEKARLLMGTKLLGPPEKKSGKKKLFVLKKS